MAGRSRKLAGHVFVHTQGALRQQSMVRLLSPKASRDIQDFTSCLRVSFAMMKHHDQENLIKESLVWGSWSERIRVRALMVGT